MLRTLQVTEEKTGVNLHDARLGKAVLDMTPHRTNNKRNR